MPSGRAAAATTNGVASRRVKPATTATIAVPATTAYNASSPATRMTAISGTWRANAVSSTQNRIIVAVDVAIARP